LLLGILAVGIITAAPAVAQSNRVERGRYLVEVACFCGVCHNTRDANGQMIPGMELAGGRVLNLKDFRLVLSNIPPGDIRAIGSNITPDPETGIGRWTDAQIVTALREGRRPDGSLIGPPMPIRVYRGISDDDMMAIVAYLRQVPAVHHSITEHATYPFPLESYGPPVDHVPNPPDDPVARGAYIAGPLAHCMDCHTPAVTVSRRDVTRTGMGGLAFEGPWGVAMAPDITAAKGRGRLGDWTDEQIIEAITRGVSADGRRLAPPMTSRSGVFSRLASADMHDLIAYLRSLPPP
jgi:cytochrome c553